MSDIFISYKREEQPIARKLANALEGEGWTVWWDPKLRAGEHFDDVIEKALNEAKCVIVMWSERSVQSRYVRDEATYALEKDKLVPIAIESIKLPFRFRGVHTPSLLGWDGSKDSTEFRRLVEDITAIVGSPATTHREVQPADRQKIKLDPGTIFRDKLKDGSQGPEMVVIPAEAFQMGNELDLTGNEKPVHKVNILKPFAMGRHEVTFEEYDRFATATNRQLPGDKGWGRNRRPVINVSWNDAMDYAEWLCHQTAKRYRLPTESEWEYAARAGTETAYWWGNEMKAGMANCADKANYIDAFRIRTSLVGSFSPNPFGLYDTAGNVWEWVQDCWHENYYGAPGNGTAWKDEGGGECRRRVIRGGSWFDKPEDLRSSGRGRRYAVHRSDRVGFRLAQDID